MTCIVAWLRKDDVIIGGDSAAVSGLHLDTRVQPKVFVNGPMAMGFTSSFRMGDLLQHALVIPERDERKETIDKYMRTTFINAVRTCLKDGGYAETDKSVETGGTFIVGYEGRIFEVEGDYQVGESWMPFSAVGCGAQYAKGSMMASHLLTGSQKYLEDPQPLLEQALDIAAHFSGGVRPPFNFVSGGLRTGIALPLAA